MTCPYCHKPAEWISHEVIYGTRFNKKSHMIWLCRDCMAYVGCHQNTKKPLGTMADKETREWRVKTHAVIDELWKSGRYSRGEVYARLSDAFGERVHVGESGVERCKQIIETVPHLFDGALFPKQ